MSDSFYKNSPEDKIWWLETSEEVGLFEFSFDKVRIYNFFRDYPQELTPEEREIFRRENPKLAALKEKPR